MTFDKETHFVGYPKAKLFMEVDGYDDLDVFVWLQKLDKFGNVLSEFVVPNHGPHFRISHKKGHLLYAIKALGKTSRIHATTRFSSFNR